MDETAPSPVEDSLSSLQPPSDAEPLPQQHAPTIAAADEPPHNTNDPPDDKPSSRVDDEHDVHKDAGLGLVVVDSAHEHGPAVVEAPLIPVAYAVPADEDTAELTTAAPLSTPHPPPQQQENVPQRIAPPHNNDDDDDDGGVDDDVEAPPQPSGDNALRETVDTNEHGDDSIVGENESGSETPRHHGGRPSSSTTLAELLRYGHAQVLEILHQRNDKSQAEPPQQQPPPPDRFQKRFQDLLRIAQVLGDINYRRLSCNHDQLCERPQELSSADDMHRLRDMVAAGLSVADELVDLVPQQSPQRPVLDIFLSKPGEEDEPGGYNEGLLEKLRGSLNVFFDRVTMQASTTANPPREMFRHVLTAHTVVSVLTFDAVRKPWPLAELLCGLARLRRHAAARETSATRNLATAPREEPIPLIIDAMPGSAWMASRNREGRNVREEDWFQDLKLLLPLNMPWPTVVLMKNSGKQDHQRSVVENVKNALLVKKSPGRKFLASIGCCVPNSGSVATNPSKKGLGEQPPHRRCILVVGFVLIAAAVALTLMLLRGKTDDPNTSSEISDVATIEPPTVSPVASAPTPPSEDKLPPSTTIGTNPPMSPSSANPSSSNTPTISIRPTVAPTLSPAPSQITTQPTITDWRQLGMNAIEGEGPGDLSGSAVALSADGYTIAIAARYAQHADFPGVKVGHLRVYQYDPTTLDWNQQGADIDGEGIDEQFGFSLALSADGSVLAAGATEHNSAGVGSNSGQVRVFTWDTEILKWTPLGQYLDGEAPGDWFGYSVDLSSDGFVVAVGAYSNAGINGDGSGHARVFKFNVETSQWEQRGQELDGEAAGDGFGASVALSSDGTIVAVGSDGNAGVNGSRSGHVRVFSYQASSSEWSQLGMDIDGVSAGDEAGFAVALSSDGLIVAIGAHRNDGPNDGNDYGHVRVWKLSSTLPFEWIQMGQDIDGKTRGDHFGLNVALSANGQTVAVNAPLSDPNGLDSGHVRIFDYNNATLRWEQVGDDLDGEITGDYFGGDWGRQGVALSADGRVVAAGAPYNDGNGDNAGHVRIFSRP